jgi:hypothetical protein
VQPVGQLDDQHADVLGHGEHELAEILRLLAAVRDEIELRQLGHAVDQARDLAAELAFDVAQRRDRVLDRVVQQPGHDRCAVQLLLGQDAGHFDGVREIGIAGGALLIAVRLHRKHVGSVERLFVRGRIVALNPFDQFVLPHHAGALLRA